ncbi:glycosyltransferase [Ferrimicrobium acidiphilum]|uniref:glycosyltransferase n=1 Tax=Ferrimicrobium acidiphilum TaxID=121039 RepID=UPI0023F09639|nr:glycosyltransferase [Ferrimicrobium acidiphilum]
MKKVVIEGATRQTSSRGIVNVNLAHALALRGLDVTVSPWDCTLEELDECTSVMFAGARQFCIDDPHDDVDVRIRQVWPPVWSKPHTAELFIVIEPFESGSIPLSWLADIESVDALWVPSNFVKQAYVQAGVHPGKVWVVPNGTDAPRYPFSESKVLYEKDEYRIGFMGECNSRAGIDVAFAGLNALSSNYLDKCSFIIKEPGGDGYHGDPSLLEALMSRYPRVAAKCDLVTANLSRVEVLQLVHSFDLLLHPYRSQGFGLPPIEAMSLQTLVAVTANGATSEFAGPESAIMIASELAIEHMQTVDGQIMASTTYHYEPNAISLANGIRSYIDNPGVFSEVIRNAYERSRQFTWDQVATIAEQSLEGISIGRQPSDKFTTALADLSESLRLSDAANVERSALSLLGIGDFVTASRQFDRYASTSGASMAARTLGQTLRAQSQGSPDLWSGAIYREGLYSGCGSVVAEGAYVHMFEGEEKTSAEIASYLAQFFASCHSVLDIGCGQGALMRRLRAQGKQVHGLDSDPRLVGRLNAEGFDVIQGVVPDDLQKLDQVSFDGVFMGHIVEHLEPNKVVEILSWVRQHISGRGTVVIQTPNFANDFVGGLNFWLDASHVRPYPVPLLCTLLEVTGFVPNIAHCREVGPVAPLDLMAVGHCGVQIEAPLVNDSTPQLTARKRIAHFGIFKEGVGYAYGGLNILDAVGLSSEECELIMVNLDSAGSGHDGCLSFDSVPSDVIWDTAIVDCPAAWLPLVMPMIKSGKLIWRAFIESFPLTREVAAAMRRCDQIWAGSEYVKMLLAQSGVDEHLIRVMPPSRELVLETPTLGSRIPKAARRFLSIFKWEARKAPDVLIECVAAALALVPDVRLTIKTSGVSDHEFWELVDGVVHDQGAIRKMRSAVEVIAGDLSRSAVLGLYQDADVFLLPSRGEGFGLPFYEAVSHGIPCIAPAEGGQRDFLDESNSLLVESKLVPAARSGGGAAFAGHYWREVDHAGFTEAIVSIASDPDMFRRLRAGALTFAREAMASL